MHTNATLAKEGGLLHSSTRIWTTNNVFGFTGSVLFVLTSPQGELLHKTDPVAFGVDGVGPSKITPGLVSDRQEELFTEISPDITRKAGHLYIVQTYTPKDRLRTILATMWDRVKTVKEFVEQVCKDDAEICKAVTTAVAGL